MVKVYDKNGHLIDVFGEGAEERPEGYQACGNDKYPECVNACPLQEEQ